MIPFYFWHLVMQTCFSLITMFSGQLYFCMCALQKTTMDVIMPHMDKQWENTHVCVLYPLWWHGNPRIPSVTGTCHTYSWLGCQKIEVLETEVCVSVNEGVESVLPTLIHLFFPHIWLLRNKCHAYTSDASKRRSFWNPSGWEPSSYSLEPKPQEGKFKKQLKSPSRKSKQKEGWLLDINPGHSCLY